MAIEETLVIIKPDGVKMRVERKIIKRYEQNGLTVVKRKVCRFSENRAERLYAEHVGKFYFAGLVLSMSKHFSVALILRGENAIAKVREMNGAKNPENAEVGTIRRDFRSAGGPFNTVHASDSAEAVLRERKIVGVA